MDKRVSKSLGSWQIAERPNFYLNSHKVIQCTTGITENRDSEFNLRCLRNYFKIGIDARWKEVRI